MSKTLYELFRERSRIIKVPAIISALVMAAGVLATFLFADYLSRLAANDFASQSQNQTRSFARTVESKTAEFEQILLLLATLHRSNPAMNQQQWSDAIAHSQIIERHPFVLGVGFVDVIKPEALGEYQASRQEEQPGFTVFPAGNRDVYAAIRYLSPKNEVNDRAIGYDMHSETIRRAAMNKARDEGKVTLTAPVQLVQDRDDPAKRGVLIYYPVYRQSAVLSDTASRRENLVGYTYLVMRPSDLIEVIARSSTPSLESASYSVTDAESNVSMVDSIYTAAGESAQFSAVQNAKIIDRQWTIVLTDYQSAIARYTTPGVTFLLGVLASIGLGGLVMYLMTRRIVRLDTQHQRELQRTKDELLALTSHQLRTPASGVKQYIGMLLQGFVGELSEDQRMIAQKAFAANERQLETINQLLHVAKADADQLVLEKTPLNLGELTQNVVDAMKNELDNREGDVVLKIRKSPTVIADERYIRMVIENFISNAHKYSDPVKKIVVTVACRSDQACVAVRDYGVGLSEDDIKRLFKKFSRVPNRLSKSVGGTGLGLFLSHQIMLAHQGDIEVDSKPGRGSIFTLTLPYDKSNESEKEAT